MSTDLEDDGRRSEKGGSSLESRVALPSSPGAVREANREALVKAARAFVAHHLKGQPKTPGTLYPFTYAQEAWHNEWDNRLETLIWAVAIDRAPVPESDQ